MALVDALAVAYAFEFPDSVPPNVMPEDYSTIYRILDSSTNRASEGLRTLEELARFGLDDASLAAELKSLRHDLTSALQTIQRSKLLAARDTEGDVGTALQEPTEYRRRDLKSVLLAAAARVQQSLRVLEECSKPIDPILARSLEKIRYRSYTVCGELESSWPQHHRVSQLAKAKLYVLIDAAASESQFEQIVLDLCRGGVDVLQLRDRQVDDQTLIARGRLGTKLAKEQDVLFIMNDRADLALAADCDGVHVGQEELPVDVARQILGPQRLIGLSTHSIDQARRAVQEGADYIGCGPVFPGQTKQFANYVGTGLLKEVANEIDLPAFAIGGIDTTNLPQITAAQFQRVAVAGVVRNAENPIAMARKLKQQLS
ncbi:MAG: thiamine phosphate synthase [Rubripirellula sp.]